MNIFSQFIKSLYSPKHIASFRFQGIGKAILYAFLLSLITILPSSIYLTNAILDGADHMAKTLTTDFPEFEIKDGRLHSDESLPVIINDDVATFHFDSTGSLNANDITSPTGVDFGILQDEFVIAADGESQTIPYSMIPGLELTNEKASDYIKSAKTSLYIIIGLCMLVMYLFTTAIFFLEITLLAYLTGLFVTSMNRKATFGQQWRIATYSFTLAVTFFTFMNFIQVPVIGDVYVKWFITLMMIYLTIKEMPIPKSKQKTIQS
ncbi:DUF1189 domain-containing protein [Pradoshia sp. D12]|uniref:DUF1189 domain-containing protein n=1 Tax=Bacillaceae TaxID=186817 RepID=UPI0011269A09|nr:MULTISPECIES: DUF1189 domain-containing protein [Bacillaceae]QFK72208.1 DUF1189 domain-containing protein [Pradoshia sp. D12]TPF71299.1 DUF1189 domain-containing protein [Bacillus sp. D12]